MIPRQGSAMNWLKLTVKKGGSDWRKRADLLIERFDDAFPAHRMTPEYIAACYPEFQNITMQHFGQYMAAHLGKYRREN